ncbi:MAG: hypothetical protein Q8N63_04805 [Nanoarchaeota archaeon]|nr:hypothetical protein [Nanoarchaeota archaeon]
MTGLQTKTKTENLGRAITALGLEGMFLANDEIANFPLVNRGHIFTEIISEKLNRGEWMPVLEMIYGDSGKAGFLYEGNRDQLKEKIIQSAQKSGSEEIRNGVVETLIKNKEHDFLFRLANTLPLSYRGFIEAADRIPSSYFEDINQGKQRIQTLHEIAGRKALGEGEHSSAQYHFKLINDKNGIQETFDSFMLRGDFQSSADFAEEVALSVPEKRESALKKIIMSCVDKEKGISPVFAFGLYKKHAVALSDGEKEILYYCAAERAESYEIDRAPLNTDSQLKLLWAKKRFQSEPKKAYEIFRDNGYNGAEKRIAVREALELERYGNRTEALGPEEIEKADLKDAYKSPASLEVKIRIAVHLKDVQELRKLSIQAKEKGNIQQAYNLWAIGNGDLEGEYATEIRQKIIQEGIREHSGYISLYSPDNPGRIQAYDALMKAAEGAEKNKTSYLYNAYKIAGDIEGDGSRIQKAREAMVASDLIWAFNIFTRPKKDVAGIDYVLGLVAKQHGADKATLAGFVEKYFHD